MATQRPVCPACGDSRLIRHGGQSVECPLHDGPVMDSAASSQIRENILEHARRNPQPQISPEPDNWQAIAGQRGRSWRALGAVACIGLIVLVLLTLAVVVLS